MANKEVFGKNDPTVLENTRNAHQDYCDQLDAIRADRSITVSEMTMGADAGPAATYRMMNPDENITLVTMSRFAAALGMKVKVSLVPMDEDDSSE